MIEVRQEAGVAVLRLSAPPLNLLTQDLRRAIREAVETAEADPSVRAIVLTGGPHFCAGADLKEFSARTDPAVADAHCRNGHAMALRLACCDKPLIAAIEGACLGGGLEIALCCDQRIAARTAKLGLPEINRGIFPGTGGIFLMERLIGPTRAKRLILSGETMEASSALADGIVDQRVEPGTALDVAREAALRLAGQPSGSVQAIKRLADAEFRRSLAAYLREELAEYVAAYRRSDAQEGWRSFLEKRPAVWAHS